MSYAVNDPSRVIQLLLYGSSSIIRRALYGDSRSNLCLKIFAIIHCSLRLSLYLHCY
ncbi:hypothetical protein EMIT0P265_30005 [Pseudomonas zeae]